MNKMPKISIIIPVYNAENYLKKCLDSLINQTFKDIEILCINDNSIDQSLNILKKYAASDERIKVFSQEHLGLAAARNVGLANATGEYLMFCDNDDSYEPDMCKIMYETITNVQTDCVMCHSNIIRLDERKISDKYFNSDNLGLIKRDLHTINVIIWNKIFKKSIIDKWQISFPDGHLHEDDCFWYKYALCCKNIYIIDNKLYNYVIHKDSAIGKYASYPKEVHLSRLYITQNLLEFAEQHNLFKRNRQALVDICKKELKLLSKFINLDDIKEDIFAFYTQYGIKLYVSPNNKLIELPHSKVYYNLQYMKYRILYNFVFGDKRTLYQNKKKEYKKYRQYLNNFELVKNSI